MAAAGRLHARPPILPVSASRQTRQPCRATSFDSIGGDRMTGGKGADSLTLTSTAIPTATNAPILPSISTTP